MAPNSLVFNQHSTFREHRRLPPENRITTVIAKIVTGWIQRSCQILDTEPLTIHFIAIVFSNLEYWCMLKAFLN